MANLAHEVIEEKLKFWQEASVDEPKLNIMQKYGIVAVSKMYELN